MDIPTDDERLNKVRFADDDLAEIKTVPTELSAACEEVGLQSNITKN